MLRTPIQRWLGAVLTAGLTVACASCGGYTKCAEPSAQALGALPPRLSQTGLYADASQSVVSQGVRGFEPAFPLWSDGAAKRRFVFLPSGTRIDSSDVDDWEFPEGTKLWKEFSVAGKRLETRLLVKTGPGAGEWSGAAYVWTSDGKDALLSVAGVDDVAGTAHDAPSAKQCVACHAGRRSYVLGFSAVQLSDASRPGGSQLDALAREGLLTAAPPPVTVPGDALDRQALGYLHANCGNCHNAQRPPSTGPRCYDPRSELEFWLPASTARVADAPAYRTSLPDYVSPGRPDDSHLISLMERRGGFFKHMPPLATEQVDAAGTRLLRSWIARMPAKEE